MSLLISVLYRLPNRCCGLLLLLMLPCACNAQLPSKDSVHLESASPEGAPKIIKNYFITQYPQAFFSVQCGLQDQNGNLWFGTSGNGIYVYDGKSFVNFTHKHGLCHDDILCCTEDSAGRIWFGTRNGLIVYRPSGQKATGKDFSNIIISENTIDHITRTKISYDDIPPDNFVWSILQDKTGKLWFGTNSGIYIHSQSDYTGQGAPLFTRFLDNDRILNRDKVSLNDVLCMAEDTAGNIWFASGAINGEGILRYDGHSIIRFAPDGLHTFRSIAKGKKGNLYFINALRGVYVYDGQSFRNFSEAIGLKNDAIAAIREDQSGNFWFGTNSDNMHDGGSGGVWRYDGQSLHLFTTKDGLSHNCVVCIVEDRSGNLWFGTRNTGLCRYNGQFFVDFSE